jgi:hypothetical protein
LKPYFKGCTAAYGLVVLRNEWGSEITLQTGAIVKLPRARTKRVFIAGLEFLGTAPYQYKNSVVSLTLLLVSMNSWSTFKGGK